VTENILVRLVNKIIIDAYTQGAPTFISRTTSAKPIPAFASARRRHGGLSGTAAGLLQCANFQNKDHGQPGHLRAPAWPGRQDCFRQVGAVPIDLRVAVVPTSNNREDAVLRILGGVEPLPLDQLGLRGRDLEELRKMIAHTYGLFWSAGPTGSGKTTTLHSVLHHINNPDMKIWTAETQWRLCRQAATGADQCTHRLDLCRGHACISAGRSRRDHDRRMRDAETTKIAIEASLTGHLVFSTLHTNSAAESVVRLLDLGMDPFNFADALIGILSQRLARKLARNASAPTQEAKRRSRSCLTNTAQKRIWTRRQSGSGGLRNSLQLGHWLCTRPSAATPAAQATRVAWASTNCSLRRPK